MHTMCAVRSLIGSFGLFLVVVVLGCDVPICTCMYVALSSGHCVYRIASQVCQKVP